MKTKKLQGFVPYEVATKNLRTNETKPRERFPAK
jgi:hypothetical protein